MLSGMIARRLSMIQRTGGLFLACAAVTCGGAPAAPQAPAVAGPVAPAPAPPPPVDLSPVAEPPGLYITGRLAKLGASFAVAHDWTGLPMPQSEQVSEIIAGGPLGSVVDLDEPIDLAVSATGKDDDIGGLVALAAGVHDPEAAKALLAERFKLTPASNGIIALRPAPPQPNGSGDDGRSDDDRHPCELAPAAGRAPMRLVCGLDEASLTALAPWLTRTAARADGGTDGHVEIHLGPVKKVLADGWQKVSGLLDMMFDDGSQGASGSIKELGKSGLRDLAAFVDDVESVAFDTTLDDAGATLTTTFVIPGATSPFSRLLVANADQNGPPPATFWQTPGDADAAFFHRGLEVNDYVHERDLFLRVIADALVAEGVSDRDRRGIVDALTALASPSPMAYASGVDTAALGRAVAAKRALGDGADPGERADAARAAAGAFLGWHVLESDVPAAGVVDALKGLAAVWSRPSMQAVYRAKVKMPPPSMRIVPMPAAKPPWPSGTEHVVLEIVLPAFQPTKGGKAKGGNKPFVVHAVVVPDGQRTWIGFGSDLALASSKVAAAANGAGATLRSRGDLNDMAQATLGSGAFMTSRAFAELFAEGMSLATDDASMAESFYDEVSQLPHAADPIEVSMTPRTGKAPAMATAVHISKGTIEGAVAAIVRHGGF
jgi:hypothetical protein